MKEFKIRVKNEAHYEDIQKYLFSKGVYWLDGSDDVKNTYSDFLYVKNMMGCLSLYTADEGEEYFNSFEGDEMYFYNGELQEEPAIVVDWSKAPEWANYAAKDKDGEIYFYEFEPYILLKSDCAWTDSVGEWGHYNYSPTGGIGWEDSLVERPKNTSGESIVDVLNEVYEEFLRETTRVSTKGSLSTRRDVIEAQLRGDIVQIKWGEEGEWQDLTNIFHFSLDSLDEAFSDDSSYKVRLKPKTKTIRKLNGVELPDCVNKAPNYLDTIYIAHADPSETTYPETWEFKYMQQKYLKGGRVYLTKEDALVHSKAYGTYEYIEVED